MMTTPKAEKRRKVIVLALRIAALAATFITGKNFDSIADSLLLMF